MNFLNPIALIGLAAASIPLILHLLNLRKLKTVEFSTLKFLKELQKTKIRRLKLKQILLLILRTLIIIFAVLAFARPTIESPLPVIGTYAKSGAVIIVDNSFSMDVSDEKGNRFNQAKLSAMSIIGALHDGDEAAVITMADGMFSKPNRLTRNFRLLRQDVSNIKISNTPANLEKSLVTASELLKESLNLNKEVFIITDGQPNVFRDNIKEHLDLFHDKTAVYFLQIGGNSKADIQNLSVDSLNVITRIFQLDKLVEIEAGIRNLGDKEAQGVVVSMFFGGQRVAQRTLDIPAGKVNYLTISALPEINGINKAYVQIEEDALTFDNKRYFGFIIPEKPLVAVVGPKDKTEFIELALSARKDLENPAKYEVFTPNEFSRIDLTKFDIIICAGGPYFASDFQRIRQFVKNGGGALIFADNKTSPDIFKKGINELGFGDLKQNTFAEYQQDKFTTVDKIHPLFEGVFKGTTDKNKIVESPRIYKSLNNSAGQPIIETSSGNFLSESRIGDGKLLYCAVTPDLEWSNFPVTGLFPAMIYRSIFYLTSKEELGQSITAGKPLMLTLPKRYSSGGNFKVIDPEETEFFRQSANLPSGAVLSFDKLDQLGNYSIISAQDKPVAVFSVNPDPTESVLKLFTKDEIEKALKNKISENAPLEFVEDPAEIMTNIERTRTGTELWQLFVIAALICAVAEMLVARYTKKEAGEV